MTTTGPEAEPAPDLPFRKKVDEDWKAAARREKEKLAAQAKAQSAKASAESEKVFVEFLAVLIRQAQIDLQTGQLDQAVFMIEALSALKTRTAGNLSTQEQQLLDTNLTELKRAFAMAQAASPRGGAPPATAPKTSS